ncbi:MAG: phage integrase N-terminal SAM-like domain-containing protein [Planctomycetota bacterium]
MEFHQHRQPRGLAEGDVNRFLTHLAVKEHVAASTQNKLPSYIANEFNLTPHGQSAISLADCFVDWQQEGETTTLSLRCPNIATAKRFLAIVTGLSARKMTHPSDERQTQQPTAKANELADEPRHLPDVLIDDEQSEVFDLPRKGVGWHWLSERGTGFHF